MAALPQSYGLPRPPTAHPSESSPGRERQTGRSMPLGFKSQPCHFQAVHFRASVSSSVKGVWQEVVQAGAVVRLNEFIHIGVLKQCPAHNGSPMCTDIHGCCPLPAGTGVGHYPTERTQESLCKRRQSQPDSESAKQDHTHLHSWPIPKVTRSFFSLSPPNSPNSIPTQ